MSKITLASHVCKAALAPQHTLSSLYSKILGALEKMPANAAYRQYTEQVIRERVKAVEKVKDVRCLEQEIKCGQVQDLIVQAENELLLARKMLAWKPWEPLTNAAPGQQWDWPPATINEPKI